ncbi:MAG: PAS domain S-box protein [Candidatus Cloacimonetes bacterium]|nr:PAS domain S-box protein [Candidatus Cloacimonadota bacterium]
MKPFAERELKAVIELAIYKYRVQQTIKRNENKYRRIFENIQSVYCEMDKRGFILEISPSIEDITGFQRNDLIGKNLRAIFSDPEKIDRFISLNSKKKKIKNFELELMRKNGDLLYFSIISNVIYDENEQSEKIVASFQNITESKLLERRLLQAERLAAVGQLAAGVAHEIRNPLGNINSSIQFCQKKFEIPKEINKYLDIISRNSHNANKIIQELLDFAKPREIKWEKYSLKDILERSLKLVETRIKQNNVKTEIIIDDKMPQIKFDVKWMEQVFVNLLLNSNEAMDNRGKLIIKTKLKDDKINIIFTDTGCGMSQDELTKIFDPFYTTKSDGVGLGLFLVYQVVAAHDGFFEVKSVHGKGTTFTVILPVKK